MSDNNDIETEIKDPQQEESADNSKKQEREDKIEASAVAVILRENANLNNSINTLRTQIKQSLFIIFTLIIIIAVTLLAMFGWYPKYRYIATTDNTAICGISLEDAPRVTYATLAEFAKDTVIDSFTYDYVNYRRAINAASDKWYTANGRKSLQNSLQNSGNLRRVIEGRFVIKTMTTNVPQIEEEGEIGKLRYWKVVVPMVIEFYSGGQDKPISRQDYLATVTVIQAPQNAYNKKGIAVESLILAPYIRN